MLTSISISLLLHKNTKNKNNLSIKLFFCIIDIYIYNNINIMDDLRDDKNLRHFRSRSQQLNKQQFPVPVPSQVFVVYDQGFNSQIDDTRFKYMGTSVQQSQESMHNARRQKQDMMRGRS